jgi:hypothetical protein
MASTDRSIPKFQHGRVLISPGVIDLALQDKLDVMHYFKRHLHGDWGKVPLVYKLMNEQALLENKRVLSAFPFGASSNLYVFTQIDRSVTTLLLDREYRDFRADLTH